MIVMPSNNSGFVCGMIAGTFPRNVGHLFSTDSWRQNPPEPMAGLPTMPWALDNGAFPAWLQKRPWNESAYWERLEFCRMLPTKPLWVIVPDVVADRESTLRNWFRHYPTVRDMGYHCAFAAQDGMTPDDIPPGADCVFIGGTTEWKWANVARFCAAHPNVHVGRVNSERLLWQAYDAGAKSCDGTGWFRGDRKQLAGLVRFLTEITQGRKQQMFAFA